MAKIKFTQIPVQLDYPKKHKAALSTWHSRIVEDTIEKYKNSRDFRDTVCGMMNVITMMILSGDTIPKNMTVNDLFIHLTTVSFQEMEDVCGSLFLEQSQIEWDVEPTPSTLDKYSPEQLHEMMEKHLKENMSEFMGEAPELYSAIASAVIEAKDADAVKTAPQDAAPAPPVKPAPDPVPSVVSASSEHTPKEDLFFSPRTVPTFDKDREWFTGFANGCEYAVYTTLPEIPQCQRGVTITTDIRKLRDADVMRLFPNRRIRTRPDCMYEPIDGVEMHPILGLILPIDGFTREQIIDNMIRYPFFHNPRRFVGDEIRSLYDEIEIDGELVRTIEVWDTLPISKIVPKTKEFLREYAARRFYLERDVQKIEHRYKTLGTYLPFATLFTTPDEYKQLGYSDALDLAWTCVKHRIFYHQTASPVLRACGAEPKTLEECLARCKS